MSYITSRCASCRSETTTIYVLIRVSICRDDCLNERGGTRNACTCNDDESDSETYFDTIRTCKSQEYDEDACCAESVELNFDDNVASDDDCVNQSTLCSDSRQSEDACATGDEETCESQEKNLDSCANTKNGAEFCACNESDECEDSGAVCLDESAECGDTTCNGCNDDNQCACDAADNCVDDNGCAAVCLDDDECGGNETDACADDEECAAGESDDCSQTGLQKTNTGTLQSECSYGSGDDDDCLNGGSTMRCPNCATATNTMRLNDSAEDCCDQCKTNTICNQSTTRSAQCCCAGDTGTLQSECSHGGCACNTMRSGCSCVSEESCAADAVCANCANHMGTTKSNYSESTVRSNSFECLSVANDADQLAGNTWGKTDTYQSGYNASSNQQGSCLVCMGTGTVRSRSAYADTMDSSYSQQYGNCAMQSASSAYATRTGTIRSQESDSESDLEGDAKGSAPCFNVCSCLGQNLIQLQLR